MHQRTHRYVVITPARNEGAYIRKTIQSMVAQTLLPVKWVIVSDGSTDDTDEIVGGYAAEHEWIELVRLPERRERQFAGKVHAFNAGYSTVRGLEYEIVGNLDADVSFDADCFAFLIDRFAGNSRLGVAGTALEEDGAGYDYRFSSVDHVSGACQLFRRQCYEDIGGYVPVKGGGIDVIAVLSARMRGWETKTFTEKYYKHYRKMGTAEDSPLKARFKDGHKDYALGTHPLWEIFRTVYQMSRKPLLIGGLALFCGYFWCMIRRVDRSVSIELMSFRRKDQMRRLRKFIAEHVRLGKVALDI